MTERAIMLSISAMSPRRAFLICIDEFVLAVTGLLQQSACACHRGCTSPLYPKNGGWTREPVSIDRALIAR
jgi:hypothetical protein